MKKYLIETRSPKPIIKEIEVDIETEKCVYVGGMRILKHTKYHNIFNTFSEARSAFIHILIQRVETMEEETYKVRKVIGELLVLSKPETRDNTNE